MAEEKEPEVMTAADLKRKVHSGEEEKPSEDVTVTGEDMVDDRDAETTETGDTAEGGGADDADGTGAGAEKESEDAAGAADDSDAGSDGDKESKSKKKKKSKKKDPRDEKIEELNDRLLRNLAEFENFRNRSEKEKEARFDMGAKSVVEKILPVIDNLERGIDGLTEEEAKSPFATGIVAVYKQLQTGLSEMGVTPIEAVGKDFDPNIHQAVMHEEDDSDAVSQVVEELQKGYMYKDTVVRYSMVKVLN